MTLRIGDAGRATSPGRTSARLDGRVTSASVTRPCAPDPGTASRSTARSRAMRRTRGLLGARIAPATPRSPFTAASPGEPAGVAGGGRVGCSLVGIRGASSRAGLTGALFVGGASTAGAAGVLAAGARRRRTRAAR
jgi:hypothetical protein